MNAVGVIWGAKQGAKDAQAQARSDALAAGRPAMLQLARIKALQAGNTYSVDVLADDDSIVATVEFVRCIPYTTYAVDDIVWLVQWDGNPILVVMGTGGGSMTDGYYYQGEYDLGFAGCLSD